MTFDIVIFGATGFTGQFVVEELAQVLDADDAPKLTWAVAGRNEGKLKKVGSWETSYYVAFCMRMKIASKQFLL